MLHAWDGKNQGYLDQIFSLVYQDLRRIAATRTNDFSVTLQPTELVHEAFIQIAGDSKLAFKNRLAFYAFFGSKMRMILVDHLRSKMAIKRMTPIDLSLSESSPSNLEEIVVIHMLMKQLAKTDPRLEQIVELKFFAGLTHEEIAEFLGMSTRTVKRDFQFAKLWLKRKWVGPS